jgi:hypothetical protein
MLRRLSITTTTALVAAGAMLVVAIGAGAAVGVIARPTPQPTATPTPFASATPVPDTAALVFQQPLSAGCATADAVWVVSNGGGIGRFDGQRWQLIDTTLRSLVAATCAKDPALVLAVGPAGRVLSIDDAAKTIRPDDIGFTDLYGVAAAADGVLVVGSQGTVQRQTFTGWEPYNRGLAGEDLFGVAGFPTGAAWAVGAGGVAYRLDADTWSAFDTGTTSSLRTVSGASVTDSITAGDDGTLLRFDGRWKALDSGVKTTLRASLRAGEVTYVVGDGGVALSVSGSTVTRLDLGTTCTLYGVFAGQTDDTVWFVGTTGTRAGVWRRAGTKIDRWGSC